ncbi:MAG: hypothetical protein IT442_16305, partial [Phycisphaeraceae bacterium]|nr:hypothetical protein [Phycisphaeraceae bacterium]
MAASDRGAQGSPADNKTRRMQTPESSLDASASRPVETAMTGVPAGGGSNRRGEPLLVEVSWEVCNQLGGIYQVLRSKAPSMVNRWGNRYCMVGP